MTSNAANKSIRLTLQQPCPRCGAVVGQMCFNDVGDEARSTCFERRLESQTERGKIGPGRQLTYALAIWPTDVVSRATLRALLPPGQTKWAGARRHARMMAQGQGSGSRNKVSEQFQKQLQILERSGLIHRGTEFVRILDRRALLDRALYLVHNPEHQKFLHLDRAVGEIEKQIRAERRENVKEIRQRELATVRQLMQPHTMNGRDSRLRTVRQEPGAIEIPLGATTGQRPKQHRTPTFPVEKTTLP